MDVSYFPGCTLRTKAKHLDQYARACAQKLGVRLCEIPDWQCCGGVYVTANDEIATKLSSVRALSAAADAQQPLVTVCSACHNVLKQTNYAMQTDAVFRDTVNRYIAQQTAFAPYNGQTTVYHYLELLRDVIGFDKVKRAVVHTCKGQKIAAYYGCLLLRPGAVMRMDDPENPQIMEDLLRAVGAEPVSWASRNECCGGYITLENASAAHARAQTISDNARANGATCIMTACPLCKYNLEKCQSSLPVVYFTEVLAQALGVKEEINANQN